MALGVRLLLFAAACLTILCSLSEAFTKSHMVPQTTRGCLGCAAAQGVNLAAATTAIESAAPFPMEKTRKNHQNRREFSIGILGDLHLDEADMALHNIGRDQMAKILEGAVNPHLVSLGDLGAYGSAGTTKSFDSSKEYLGSFGADFDIVTGNHDLEGIEEFATDAENLAAFLKVFHKKAPQFCNEIAEKTLCVGLSTVRFRDAESSSHEVYVDRGQIEWFEEVLERHPASQGWKVLVFSHAPILGSNLRTLQDVHVKNGCAWINHGDQKTRRVFIELCRKHECITAWFSGHFHLSHDYKESITTGGSGQAFVQVGVIGERSQRDGRRQSRLVTGDDKGLKIFTINHHLGGKKRLDMEIVFSAKGGAPHQFVLPDNHQEWIKPGGDQWFSAHVPLADDGCFLKNFYEKHQNADTSIVTVSDLSHTGKVCWWHMADGKVLGLHDGMLVEYDSSTLAPLGIVVDKKELAAKQLVIADHGRVAVMYWKSTENAVGVETKVIHPNDDGSYYRRFQRNKLRRREEERRESIAQQVAETLRQTDT